MISWAAEFHSFWSFWVLLDGKPLSKLLTKYKGKDNSFCVPLRDKFLDLNGVLETEDLENEDQKPKNKNEDTKFKNY